MLTDAQQQNLVARLNRIEGQVRGIRRMVEEPRNCVDILQQLAAATAVLGRMSQSILTFHVEHCVPDAISKGPAEQRRRLKELAEIAGYFVR